MWSYWIIARLFLFSFVYWWYLALTLAHVTGDLLSVPELIVAPVDVSGPWEYIHDWVLYHFQVENPWWGYKVTRDTGKQAREERTNKFPNRIPLLALLKFDRKAVKSWCFSKVQMCFKKSLFVQTRLLFWGKWYGKNIGTIWPVMEVSDKTVSSGLMTMQSWSTFLPDSAWGPPELHKRWFRYMC